MVPVLEADVSRFCIGLNQCSVFVSVRIHLFPILEQAIGHVTVETGDKTTIFVTDNLVAIESTDIDRTVARELDGLVAHGRKVQTKIVREILADFIAPGKSHFPTAGLHTTDVHPNLAVPVIISQREDVLFLVEHVNGLFLEIFECYTQT